MTGAGTSKADRHLPSQTALSRPRITSDYWRIWYYLAEAAGLEVWLVNARDVKHLPGRSKTDRLDCVWLCKLSEWGMLRRSFVPPEPVRDLRALTRLRANLTHDRVRHQNRIEKILEDALLKVSSVISDLMGGSGRRFLQALADGERSPAALAALGDYRLHASKAELKEALTGRRTAATISAAVASMSMYPATSSRKDWMNSSPFSSMPIMTTLAPGSVSRSAARKLRSERVSTGLNRSTSGGAVIISLKTVAEYDPDPTTSISFFLLRIRARASRRRRFSASRNTDVGTTETVILLNLRFGGSLVPTKNDFA